jgi:tRNA threonylcarbamoyladenosine biosynthesis protein TsaE
MTFLLRSLQETAELGHKLSNILRPGDVIALSGSLGAGKTSLARAILSGLGLDGEAPSPTFALVIPYDPPDVRLAVLHVDLYRLDTAEQTMELGLDEARADYALLIEWPERMGDLLWPDALQLSLDVMKDGARRLTALVPPSWNNRWPIQ